MSYMESYYLNMQIVLLIMGATALLVVYTIVHSGILWITTKWKKRTLYQRFISILGAALFILIPVALGLLKTYGI